MNLNGKKFNCYDVKTRLNRRAAEANTDILYDKEKSTKAISGITPRGRKRVDVEQEVGCGYAMLLVGSGA